MLACSTWDKQRPQPHTKQQQVRISLIKDQHSFQRSGKKAIIENSVPDVCVPQPFFDHSVTRLRQGRKVTDARDKRKGARE